MLNEMDQDDAGYGYASEDVCDIDSCIGLVRRSVSVHIFSLASEMQN